jgi:hypothetical protein
MDEALTYKGMQIAMTPSLVSGESHAVRLGVIVGRSTCGLYAAQLRLTQELTDLGWR